MKTTPLWTDTNNPLSAHEHSDLRYRLQSPFVDQLSQQNLPPELATELSRLYLPLAAWLNQRRTATAPLTVGINGSQGSGKSTLCSILKWLLESSFDCHTCIISIDDLYLPKATRLQLAETIHPLLATRGVPGTHDVELGLTLLDNLKNRPISNSVKIPRFNKATDDRLPQEQWDSPKSPFDLILFEGWCVAATPQSEHELTTPLNRLEKEEDPDGHWRHYTNQQLKGPYQQLFAQLDLLLLLKIPNWEMVYHWRKRQETQLAARSSDTGVMNDTSLRRFIMHYERLTRHQLQTLPHTADLVMELDRQQRVTNIQLR